MKIRSGFVSNSSSSSFCVLGVRISKERFEELGGYEYFEVEKHLYCKRPDGENYAIIGKSLGQWDSYTVTNIDLDILNKDSIKITQTLEEVLNQKNIKIQLIYGTTY